MYLARLREAVALIVKVEKEARETSLSPEPVFDELGRSLASAERLSHRYSRVAAVMRVVMETAAIFPIHQRFQESLKEELERWPHISDATLAEGLEIHGTYQLLQSKFERIEAELSAMTSRLLPLVESKAEDLADILRKIINQHEALVAAIYSDEIEPGEGLERLDALLAECEAIAESIEEPRERYCRILGVGPEATPAQIKRAYRRLVSKCREAFGLDPDPEAENRFIEVNKAYKAIMAMHIHEEHCHV